MVNASSSACVGCSCEPSPALTTLPPIHSASRWGAPLNVELKLEVWDSPNSAGIVIDAFRLAKLALNNGVAGALEGPSSYLMKSPPKQIVDDEAYEATERFIKDNARKRVKPKVEAEA